MITELTPELKGTWRQWKALDEHQLRCCDVLLVTTMDGWKDSTGVQAEIRHAKLHNKAIVYLNPNTLEVTEKP